MPKYTYKYLKSILIITLVSALSACASSTSVGSFETTESTQELFEDEKRLWDLSEEYAENFRLSGLLYDDAELNTYLQNITNDLFPEFKDQRFECFCDAKWQCLCQYRFVSSHGK